MRGGIVLKRFFIVLMALVISVPLALGLVAGLSYYTTSDSIVPRPTLVVMDKEVTPTGYEWREPVFGGLVYRDFLQENEASTDLGQLLVPTLTFTTPDGYDTSARILLKGEEIWSGTSTELEQYQFLDNGQYQLRLACENQESETKGYGRFDYFMDFVVKVEPRIDYSNAWVSQGDVLALRVYNLGTDMVPTAETTLGPVNFVTTGDGQMTAYIPVSHDVESGSFPVTVTLGSYEWEVTVRSIEVSFQVQHESNDDDLLAIVDPAAAEAAKAAQTWMDNEYYNTINPLLDEWDKTQHWSGQFIMPVEGTLLNEYGLFIYTNNATQPSRHTGIDIRADGGTLIVAPNAGKVVFAGDLTSTGKTVVIEHGGGLKSLLFHMNSLKVEAGDMVQQGDEIGTVGATGNTTVNHLHYEVRLGRASLNPTLICGGTSNLYFYTR